MSIVPTVAAVYDRRLYTKSHNGCSSSRTILQALVVLCCVLTGCHPKQTKLPIPTPPPTGPSADELAYQAGLAAFRLATPEAYQRAANAFRKASELKKDRCEYTLHLAESLYFLAQQQKQNWED